LTNSSSGTEHRPVCFRQLSLLLSLLWRQWWCRCRCSLWVRRQ